MSTRLYPIRTSTPVAAYLVLILSVGLPGRGVAQEYSPRLLSPSGYTGAFNTPTAEVQPWGIANIALSNNNPEFIRRFPEGSFGSINAGIGLLPGLELVGRLSYDGDLNCNAYVQPCPSDTRDLSVSAKYQLPLSLWNGTRVALGVTDYGGAATLYRQTYGVATTAWKDLEVSLGYARPSSKRALMDGFFGSVRYPLSRQWHLLAEHDTKEVRAGLQFQHAVGDRASLMAGISRKWTNQSNQQSNQVQVGLVFHMDRSAPRPTVPEEGFATQINSSNQNAQMRFVHDPSHSGSAKHPPGEPQSVNLGDSLSAPELATLLQDAGYADIKIQHWKAKEGANGHWKVTAEPRAHRHSHIEALGHALRVWIDLARKGRIADRDELSLVLTYQREPILFAQGQSGCLVEWSLGGQCTGQTYPLVISRTAISSEHATQARSLLGAPETAEASAGPSWGPQIALSPALRNTLGTEYGLADYSLAAQVSTEVGLFLPGLFWQGIYLIPIGNSDDYEPGRVFGDGRYQRQWHSGQLTYWKSLPMGLQVQASTGMLTPFQKGGQLDAIWLSNSGRLRIGITSGRYRNDLNNQEQLPLYTQVRYSLIPGAWHAELTAGQYMNGDRGFKLGSVHWAGDTRLVLQLQRSSSVSMPERTFLGFTVSFPLGPKTAKNVGPIWLRGQDRWNWGLQTKVGEKDNLITAGYGDVSRQRHGLWSDVTDHDRTGNADLLSQLPRLRNIVSQPR